MKPTEIRLVIPSSPEYLRLARLTAADVASRVGLTYEEIEDLRIAVDELCYALLHGATGALELRYVLSDDAIEVDGFCDDDGSGAKVEASDLSRSIVRAVVDEHSLAGENGTRRFWLRKRIQGHG